jgi:UMF1 family MFS transporter
MPITRKSLYPLAGLPNQGQLWSWISFDVANQSFTLIINTLLFSLFFTKVVLRGQGDTSTVWSLTFAGSMLLVVVASPIAGAVADARSAKKRFLLATGLICGGLTCLFGLIEPGQLSLALLLYVPANFCFNIGENFLASFLPELARREHFGKLSGFSWGVAYSAALLLLVLTAAAMKVFHLMDAASWRPIFVGAGLWFIAFAIPTLLFLRERRQPVAAASARSILVEPFARLMKTAREASKFRDLFMLLAASLFYGGAMSVIISFASIMAEQFGLNEVALVVFVAVITVSGVIGTLFPTLFQDRLGNKVTTLILLGFWLVAALLFAWYSRVYALAPVKEAVPIWPLWALGNVVGFGLGSLGAANRAFVGALTPPDRSAEFFGLWGLVFKLAAVLIVPFAMVKDRIGLAAAFLVLAGLVVVGLVLTLFVDERRGIAAAGGE